MNNRKIVGIILGLVVVGFILFIAIKMQMDKQLEKAESSLIMEDSTSKVQEEEKPKYEEQEDKTVEESKARIQKFIETYYSYDYKNPSQHLEKSEDFLTPDFYKELKIMEENDMKPPVFAYRDVTNVEVMETKNEEIMGQWTAEVTADLWNEKKEKMSTVLVEFTLDIKKDKIAYFTVIGKRIEQYE
ncbi:hypothetical protein [Bacillus sp. Au-Bac7]|uniref:hypothetical protein n=1 Tax=Bacillus sp. Au-Bac7 TaxID=2906458 RepID=UPI001E516AC9|nr:hypothetical protein [Bacillus sp. Au-Bac7]MCE4051673.1 hypothetical protein [Bacillus sp. Au-Bac7]